MTAERPGGVVEKVSPVCSNGAKGLSRDGTCETGVTGRRWSQRCLLVDAREAEAPTQDCRGVDRPDMIRIRGADRARFCLFLCFSGVAGATGVSRGFGRSRMFRTVVSPPE